MFGRLYETPLKEKHAPFRVIDKGVQAWRNGERATNPHSDMYREHHGRVFACVRDYENRNPQ